MAESPGTDDDEENTSEGEERTYAGDAAEAAEMIEADETEGFVMVVAQDDPERPDGLATRTSIAATSTAISQVEGLDYAMLATALHSVAEGNNVSLKRAAASVLKYAREHGTYRWG